MKRFLSFLLAVFMMYTCLSACNQDEPVVDPDDGQQDVVEPNKDQVGEDMDSDIPAEDESVQILNLHIPLMQGYRPQVLLQDRGRYLAFLTVQLQF